MTLNSFLRVYSLDASRQISEISRRMQQSGGYDYYRIVNEAIRAKINGSSNDEINYILNSSSNPSEISHNKAAFSVFEEKFGSKRGLEVFKEKRYFKLADGLLSITVSPTFSHQTTTALTVYHVWATQVPPMDRTLAGVGLHVIRQAFKRSNGEFKFFDAVGGTIFNTTSNLSARAVEMTAKRIVEIARSA